MLRCLAGQEVAYDETNIIKKGPVIIEKDNRKRNCLHVVPGNLGDGPGAGLFTKQSVQVRVVRKEFLRFTEIRVH